MKSNTIQTRKHIFILALALLVLSFFSFSVHADDSIVISSKDIGNFKPYSPITLVQSCDNCTAVNITSIYSRSASNFSLLGEFVMVKNGTIYSYVPIISLPQGEYSYCTKGDPDGTISTQCVNFAIGQEITIPMILLAIGLIFLALGIYNKEYILGFGSGISLSIVGVYVLIYGLSSFNDLYTKTIAYVTLFLGLVISFASAYEVIPFGEGGDDED